MNLTVHASPSGPHLIVWAETEPDPENEEHSAPPQHPNAASPEQLAELIRNASDEPDPRINHETAQVWLPVHNDAPVHSDPKLRPRDLPERLPTRPFNVPAVILPQPATLPLLENVIRPATPNPCVKPGTSLLYWDIVQNFILSILARQQYLPAFDAQPGKFRAQWQPAFWPQDRNTLDRLADAMPPIANAARKANRREALPPAEPIRCLEPYVRENVHNIVQAGAQGSRIIIPTDPNNTQNAGFSTIHDSWINALVFKRSRSIGGTPLAARENAAHHRAWTMPIAVANQSPYRLAVELHAPSSDENWQVSYHLQDRHHPERTMSTATVWAESQTGRHNSDLPENIRETAIAVIADAATFSPTVATTLTRGEIHQSDLDPEAAHRFITQEAQSLAQADVAVILPPLWQTDDEDQQPISFQVQVRSAQGTINFQTLFEYDWRVCIGNDPITDEELAVLVSATEPLVKIRDRWLDLHNRRLREAIRAAARRPTNMANTLQLIRMNRGETHGLAPGFRQTVLAEGPLADVLTATSNNNLLDVSELPGLLEGEPRPYQHRGYSWAHRLTAAGLGACLADDMGLGKTLQVLAVILRHKQDKDRSLSLIVCPTSVINTWTTQARQFTPTLDVTIHHGPDRAATPEDLALQSAKSDVFVTSYTTAQRDSRLLATMPWDGVYLDEAQQVKNHQSQRARACRNIPAHHRMAITGTPVENSLHDLWSLMETINPGLAGPEKLFAQRYQDPANPLRRLIQPFVLRRVKTDPSLQVELPEKIEADLPCTLTREQVSLYTAVLSELEASLRDATAASRHRTIFATITRLKQICNHPAHFLQDGNHDAQRSGKLTRLLEVLEETQEAGDKSVVFTDYVVMARILQEQIAARTGDVPGIHHGRLSTTNRVNLIEQFQNEDNPRTMIVSVRAGGTGIELTAANHACHYDRWWNPAVENQATDRINRPGQKKVVQVHTMTCAGTLEENIASIIDAKRELADQAITTGDQWLQTLTNDQVLEALSLTRATLQD